MRSASAGWVERKPGPLAAAGAGHLLPELDRLGGVVAGFRHVGEAQAVGVELLRAGERPGHQIFGGEPGRLLAHGHAIGLEHHGQHGAAQARDLRGPDPLGRMVGDDVADLVPDHGGKLGLVAADEVQHAGVDAHLAARESEGVELIRFEDHELPLRGRDLGPARRHHPAPDPLDQRIGLRVARDRGLLLDLLEGREAHLLDLVRVDERGAELAEIACSRRRRPAEPQAQGGTAAQRVAAGWRRQEQVRVAHSARAIVSMAA